jgi:predicted DNA-binding transcriptional regulator YafY
MQVYRLFEIVYILLDKKRVSTRDLADHFGVSRRTICRDIDTLGMAGIPVYAERGKGGGISLLPNFVLNKSLLSEREQSEIIDCLHSLSNIKTSGTSQVLRKMSTLFNKTTTNWLQVDFSGWGDEHDYFGSFKTAILERRIAAFDYYNSAGEKSFRRVEPVQLWFKARAWYLHCFCLDKQEMRLCKLTRIKNLTVLDEQFPSRNVAAIETADPEYTDTRPNVTLKLRIASEMAYRVYDDFHEGMVEKQADGSFITQVTWPEDKWLYGFILSFGRYITVLEPNHIRLIIKAEAERICGKYAPLT